MGGSSLKLPLCLFIFHRHIRQVALINASCHEDVLINVVELILSEKKNKAGYTAQDAFPMKGQTDEQTDRGTVEQTDGQMDRQIDEQKDGWMDGRMDRRTDGRTDAPSYRDAGTHLHT